MYYFKRSLLLSGMGLFLSGCSPSDSDETPVNITPQPPVTYTSSQFNPYGLFTGEIAANGESANVLMQIDDETELMYFNAVEFITVGSYVPQSQGRFFVSTVQRFNIDEDSVNDFVFRGGLSDERQSSDYLFSYTFAEFGEDFQWRIIDGEPVTLELPDLNPNAATLITRADPYPARESIVTGQYVLQLDGALLPAYTLTLDVMQDGSVSGLDTKGCLMTGSYDIGNTLVNVYSMSLRIDNCDIRGNYSGLMTVGSAQNSQANRLIMHLHNPINALSLLISRN
jgi:hypothetical protein